MKWWAIGLTIGVALLTALFAALAAWFFRGEELHYAPSPSEGHVRMAAYLDEAAEQIVRAEGLDHDAYCLRVHKSREQFDDGCALVRPALTARWRQCTPYRALNGGCYAVEIRQSLLQNSRVRDLLYVRAADICLYLSNPSPRTVRGASSIDCISPGQGYEMVRRLEPLVCVIAVDANEEPATSAIAIRRGRQVRDHWCHEWEELVRARAAAEPPGCWLGAERPAPGGGTYTGCRRD